MIPNRQTFLETESEVDKKVPRGYFEEVFLLVAACSLCYKS